MTKELIATAILYLEFTMRNRFLIPYYGFSFVIQINGQKTFEYPFSFSLKREKSIEWYDRTAKEFLRDAKRIERCLKYPYH